ncbi:hypothetical protein NE686_07725 [Tissierella carlieri]|jgi:hypothetical protein|uniref:Uncharacterized protein n=1 Tax=Tissierella carlieri TaxID=689904 RepID=A0ABT1SAD0_9FIRM|nr:hypothetical protein [Tissierella carlieri]MCQ4922967.1 hypothetical protein [Tissierella carlieri]
MKDKVKKVLVGASAGATTLAVTGMTAFASEGTGIVSGAIDTAVAGLKTEAGVVIGSAVGLGIVFWGAKLLWGKFKSMAK